MSSAAIDPLDVTLANLDTDPKSHEAQNASAITEISALNMGSIGAMLSAPFGTARFFDTLHKKRQSLDHEVEEYKALKDEEYRKFEAELRKVIQDQVEATAVSSNAGLTASPSQADSNGLESRRNSGGRSPTGTMLDRLRSEDGVRLQKEEDSKTPSAPVQTTEPVPDTPSHDREIEFQGLFTPKYLPLLEDPNRYSRKKATRSSSPPSDKPAELPNGRPENPTPLSSSATLPTTRFSPFPSSMQSPKFSNSAPRPRLQDLRRLSSGSDTSLTSLRSSLKQPKSPRSAKHVLFSIDNTVLSPSTSPVIHRSGKVPPIPFSGLTDLPTSTGNVPNGNAERIQAEQARPRGSVSEATSHFPRSPVRSYHQLVEPTVMPSSDGAADFEDVTPNEDALFSFDEDSNTGDKETTDDDGVCYI